MTPRTREASIGQILFARALVSNITDEPDNKPLSSRELDPTLPLKHSPNSVAEASIHEGGSVPTRSPDPPKPARKRTKAELQELINQRVQRSIAARKSGKRASPPARPKRRVDRYSSTYVSPSGQPIAFKSTGVNTPPTPRYKNSSVPVEVDWGYYGAVYPDRHRPPANSSEDWNVVVPAHNTKKQQCPWESMLSVPLSS